MTTTASEVYADGVLLYKLNIFQSRTFLIKIYNILNKKCHKHVTNAPKGIGLA